MCFLEVPFPVAVAVRLVSATGGTVLEGKEPHVLDMMEVPDKKIPKLPVHLYDQDKEHSEERTSQAASSDMEPAFL